MSRILILFLFVLTLLPSKAQQSYLTNEYVICSGGPAIRAFEDYRVRADRHDRYWGNFITAARIRMQQLRAQHGPNLNLTWLIYRPSYIARQSEDAIKKPPYICDIKLIEAAAAKVSAKIVWFDSTPQFVSFLNRHTHLKMSGFEYFGHSNKYCFLFDYSGEILGASTCFLHVKDLGQLRSGIFTRDAHVQSYGCNMADGADSMYRAWRKVTGTPMIAATGKTDFSAIKDNKSLPTVVKGTWTR